MGKKAAARALVGRAKLVYDLHDAFAEHITRSRLEVQPEEVDA